MPGIWNRVGSMFAEVRRRRVLRALGLYVVGAWVLMQVADATFEPLGIPLWVQKGLILVLVAGVVPAAILAWVYDLTRHGISRTEALPAPERALAGAPSGAIAGGDDPARPVAPGADAGAPMSPIAAVAILPFADLTPEGDHVWFCDGLAEEIIESLCCVKGLRVASRTAAFRFRDGATDPREIGRLLCVDAILEGSLRVAGGRMRVGAKLIDAHGGFQEWSETYERPTTDVFAVQREIAENVARALKLSIASPEAAARAGKYAPRTLEAYEAYLRGRQALGHFQQGRLLGAPDFFRRAIELDPQYAPAYAGLADAMALIAQWRFAPVAEALREGAAAASRAIDLAPDLAEAHTAQGQLRSLAGDLDGARRSFERALELNPSLFEAWHYYARHEYAHGDHVRAAELFERAHRARPEDFAPLVFAAASKLKSGDAEGAAKTIRRAADGLVRQTVLEPDAPRVHYLAAGALQQVGRTGEAKAMAKRALELSPDDWSTLYNLACYHVAADEHDVAFDLLERAVAMGGGYPEWMANDPDLDPLRDSPRFAALIRAVAARD